MEPIVNWWCNLLGIHDIYAIQIATGIVGGGSALLIVLFVVGLAFQLLNLIIAIASHK